MKKKYNKRMFIETEDNESFDCCIGFKFERNNKT